MNKKNQEITFKDIFNVFKPKLWLMLLVAVVMSIGAFVYSSYMKEETYTSTGMIYVYRQPSTSQNQGDLTIAKSMSDTYRIVITNRTYLSHVVNYLKEQYADKYGDKDINPLALKGMISVGAVEETPILRISVTSPDKEFAFHVATAIVDIAETRLKEAIPDALTINPVEYPVEATAYNDKNIARNSVVAFLAGVLLMAIAVWVYSIFDVTVHDVQDLETIVDVPILGVIPKHDLVGGGYNISKEVNLS